jgi:hypothetical protein
VKKEVEGEIIHEVERLSAKLASSRNIMEEKGIDNANLEERKDPPQTEAKKFDMVSDAVKALQDNKTICDRFRVRLEAALSEIMSRPANLLLNTKKETQKLVAEVNSALLKRFSVARYGPNGILP